MGTASGVSLLVSTTPKNHQFYIIIGCFYHILRPISSVPHTIPKGAEDALRWYPECHNLFQRLENKVLDSIYMYHQIAREIFEPEPVFEPRTSGFLARRSAT